MSITYSMLFFLQYYALINGEHDSEHTHSHESHSGGYLSNYVAGKNASNVDEVYTHNLCWPYPCSWVKKARSRLGERYGQVLQEIMGPLEVKTKSTSGLNRSITLEDLSTRSEIRIMISLPVSSLIFEYRRKMFNLLSNIHRASRSNKKSKRRSRRSPSRVRPRLDYSAEESDKTDPLEASPEGVDTLDLKKPTDILKAALEKILNAKDSEQEPVNDDEADY